MASGQTLDRDPATHRAGRNTRTGSAWPAPLAALAALADMGMSDEAIGRYFGVDPDAVRAERDRTKAG